MLIPVEVNLTDDTIIVHWPWGQHAFPFTDVGRAALTEAIRNFQIECTRRKLSAPKSISHADLLQIRKLLESSPVKVTKLREDGKQALPSLEELFGEDEFFGKAN